MLFCRENSRAHPGGEGIMTGLLSSEEEVRAESQQSLLDRFSYVVVVRFDSQNDRRNTSGVSLSQEGNSD